MKILLKFMEYIFKINLFNQALHCLAKNYKGTKIKL